MHATDVPVDRRGTPRTRRRLILVSITTGTFMANVDAAAVTVALPTMAREFDVGLDALQWVISGYFLTITAVLPMSGRLADIVGRKRILNTGLAVFVIASLLVALAPTFPLLTAARVLQGVGASMFMATIMATAVTTFPPDERGRVLGLLTSVVAAGTVVGPGLGGVLTDAFGWRSIFLINVPIGLLGAVGTFVLLPADRTVGRPSAKDLDLVGALLFAGFSSSLLLGLGAGPSAGWSDRVTLGLLGASLIVLGLFVAQEARSAGPVIDLGLFRRRVFGLGNVAAFLSFVLMLFPAVLFPLYLHEVMQWSLGATGILMTLQAVFMLLVSPVAGWWSDRRGSRRPALAALGLINAAMTGSVFLGSASPLWLIGVVLAFFGVGFGLFLSPNNSAVMGDLARDRAGTAGAILATVRNLGKSVGVALAVVLYSAFAGTSATVAVEPAVLLSGFRGAFMVGAVLAVVALVAVVLMYSGQEPGSARSKGNRTS
ncbi:MAG: DHA2 family efflux MFS transporter permease subunit [Actinomycetota bacterium]|nr:DHA2 family efflux MFS transporter permease subunit [Actinomycetota bacterium]